MMTFERACVSDRAVIGARGAMAGSVMIWAAALIATGPACGQANGQTGGQTGGQPNVQAAPQEDLAARERRPCEMLWKEGYQSRSVWAINLWPRGVVPYEFTSDVGPWERGEMRAAMDELELAADIHFVEGAGLIDHLRIQSSNGNSSYVGQQGGGPQNVNIYNWNYKYIMCHELMHALGMWHEQSREDRNQYIRVNYENILTRYAYNYDIVVGSAAQGPYDFESVMHYDQCGFASCACPSSTCRTMTALPPYEAYQNSLGQLSHLSDGDRAGLVSRYGESICVSFPQDPVGISVHFGQSAVFTAQATGHGTPTYRWRAGGVFLADGGRISGTQTDTLTITNTTASDQAIYDCVATVPCGSLISGGANLTVRNLIHWAALTPSSSPQARYNTRMVFDSARRAAVLFGGIAAGGLQNRETWEWNGNVGGGGGGVWSFRTLDGPSPRNGHAMVYDAARGVTMLFGGAPGAAFNNETWLWNGTAWSRRDVPGPSPRTNHAMAYDSVRGVTVLFGGTTAAGDNAETWEWNGSAWSQRNVTGPSPRFAHTMAYNAATGLTVLFGGRRAPLNNAETWEWNAAGNAGAGEWRQRNITGPTPRYAHAMVYDDIQRGIVMFGGAGIANNDETWLLDGRGWTSQPLTAPAARRGHAMVYDPFRREVILFGGYATTYDGETWRLIDPCVAPIIITQPQLQVACPYGSAQFSVVAAGTPPFTYAWRKGGVTINPATNPSAATPTLSLANITPANIGSYNCRVTGACGNVLSAVAPLTICRGDYNCDGGVDGQDVEVFFAIWATGEPQGDANGDGGVDGRDVEYFFGQWQLGC